MPSSSVESVNLSVRVSQPTSDWLKNLADSIGKSVDETALYFLANRFKEPCFLPKGFKEPTRTATSH